MLARTSGTEQGGCDLGVVASASVRVLFVRERWERASLDHACAESVISGRVQVPRTRFAIKLTSRFIVRFACAYVFSLLLHGIISTNQVQDSVALDVLVRAP